MRAVRIAKTPSVNDMLIFSDLKDLSMVSLDLEALFSLESRVLKLCNM